MNEIATAILFLASASASTSDCTADNTGAEKIAVTPDVRPTDGASCRIVGAGELEGLRGLEFVDVRPQPVRQSVTGALGSGASLAFDVRRDADLAALLKAIKHPFVDSESTRAAIRPVFGSAA